MHDPELIKIDELEIRVALLNEADLKGELTTEELSEAVFLRLLLKRLKEENDK